MTSQRAKALLCVAFASHVTWAARSGIPATLQTLVSEMREPKAHGASGALQVYSRAFAAYALVNSALEAPAAAPEASADLDVLIEQMLRPALSQPFGEGRVVVAGNALSRSVAFRGHLALMLEGRALLQPLDQAQAQLDDALVEGLAQEVVGAPNHLLPSYGNRTWPADNEVLAAAMALAVRRHPDRGILMVALEDLQQSLKTLDRGGLPGSAVKPGTLVVSDVPRGCALSWTVAMRGLYDPQRAADLYSAYRRAFFFELGPVVGFREWPHGVDRTADSDSGPIVFGIGTAASGLGIGAARLSGAQKDFEALARSSRLAGASDLESHRHREWTERAMLAWSKTARPWVRPRPTAARGP